jgi:hypothetical protein
MKKVIRLTESDLTRIVRRVLKESSEVIKVKVFGSAEHQKKGYTRSCNIDVKNIKLYGDRVRFDYTIPGGATCGIFNGIESTSGEISSTGKASIECGSNTNNPMIYFLDQVPYRSMAPATSTSKKIIVGALSKEGYAKLSYLCDEYASVEDDDMEDDDMMDNNYA